MKELSIFVDESGDFGEYDYHSPYYIIALVFHDQDNDIKAEIEKLETEMTYIGWPNHCVHAGALIRSEHEYKESNLEDRQRILKRLMTFTRRVGIIHKTVYIEKKNVFDSVESAGKLSKQPALFIRNHIEWFTSYDLVKVYYDNGQVEVTKILSSVFHTLLERVEFIKVIPSEYRLFQVADLICTLKLTELKMENHFLSKSEKFFFKDERTLKKNYLKPLKELEVKK